MADLGYWLLFRGVVVLQVVACQRKHHVLRKSNDAD